MAGTLGTLKVKDSNGAWVNIAGRGPMGPQGDTGLPGPPFIIVANFGTSKTPADLPVDGVIPVDWDEPGQQSWQMRPGHALYYEPTDRYVPDAGHLYEFVSTQDPTGWIDVGLIRGPQGPQGISSLIVGDFGAVTTPVDLPPDGLIPIDWDGPGAPVTAFQMELGQSLYYDKPADPLDGHLFQYIGIGVDPSGWLDIGNIQGPTGPTGPQGNDGVGLDEVFVGPTDPITTVPSADVWYDTLAIDPPPSNMPDYALVPDVILKANVYFKNVRGPWAVTTASSIVTFTAMPAGTYMLMAGASAVAQTIGLRATDIYLDDVYLGGIVHWFNLIGTHLQMGPQIFPPVTLTEGDHVFSFRSGASCTGDVNDYGFILLIPVGA